MNAQLLGQVETQFDVEYNQFWVGFANDERGEPGPDEPRSTLVSVSRALLVCVNTSDAAHLILEEWDSRPSWPKQAWVDHHLGEVESAGESVAVVTLDGIVRLLVLLQAKAEVLSFAAYRQHGDAIVGTHWLIRYWPAANDP